MTDEEKRAWEELVEYTRMEDPPIDFIGPMRADENSDWINVYDPAILAKDLECRSLAARLEKAKAAVRGLNALIIEAQETMVVYLVPDGIDADAAIEKVIELLDGPRQRDVQREAYKVIGEGKCEPANTTKS